MSCHFWSHKWTKWEKVLVPLAKAGASMEFQYRHCEVCGYTQRQAL